MPSLTPFPLLGVRVCTDYIFSGVLAVVCTFPAVSTYVKQFLWKKGWLIIYFTLDVSICWEQKILIHTIRQQHWIADLSYYNILAFISFVHFFLSTSLPSYIQRHSNVPCLYSKSSMYTFPLEPEVAISAHSSNRSEVGCCKTGCPHFSKRVNRETGWLPRLLVIGLS